MRRGSSLLEALLALVLLEFGLLALAAATAVAARDLATANRRVQALTLARSRVETLRSAVCDAAAAQSWSGYHSWHFGIDEHWQVSATGDVRLIVDSVVMALPAGRSASHVLRGWELCP